MEKALTAPGLIPKAKQRAAEFTWQKTARSVLTAVKAAVT
jgi:hypothetical protein